MTKRDETISRIRTALKARSGRTWSVTGGRGTAWGWIRISAPPARLICWIDDCDRMTCTHVRTVMSDDDRAMLGLLLAKDSPIHVQGESIPNSSDYYAEYVDRAEGRTPSKIAAPYWD